MAHTYETLSKINETISKPPYCNQGVSYSIKNIEQSLKHVMANDKKFKTLEGQAKLNRVLGEAIAQAYDYLNTTPFDKQKPEDIEDIITACALRANGGVEIGSYVFNNEVKQAQDAAKVAEAAAGESQRGSFGEDLSTPEGRKRREQLRSIAVESIKKIEKPETSYTYSVELKTNTEKKNIAGLNLKNKRTVRTRIPPIQSGQVKFKKKSRGKKTKPAALSAM